VKRLLVVEDGREYTEAFQSLAPRLAGAPLEVLRAGDLPEARAQLASASFDAVFLDVVFDRTPAERLAGDAAPLIARFDGDERRATRFLAENQGFYVLDALAPELGGTRIVLAHDFAAEPQRLAALRERSPGLLGLPDGASATEALTALLRDRETA
jgi:CheY-like chemotaxis protein